jgi:transglutaminase superfamily protein
MAIFETTPGLLYAAPLAGGDQGTEQTVALLRSLVDDAWKDPFVNRTAIEIIRNAGVPPFDQWGQIRAIYDYARSFYFVNDPITKEAVRPTRELLQLKAGDCDDINANILPSLLGTIGFETRLVTVASDPNVPDYFSHVYCEVFIDGDWYPLDAARPGAVIGVAPAHFYRRAWWSLTDGSHGDYPADGSGMEGYRPQVLRGLGSVTSDLSTIFTDASGALKSVGGQTVQSALGPAIGPGGAAMQIPPATQPFLSSGLGELLVVGAILGGLWLLTRD